MGAWELAKDTIKGFIADEALSHGASIAYYTLFAVAPVLLIIVAIAALVFGREAYARRYASRSTAGLASVRSSDTERDALQGLLDEAERNVALTTDGANRSAGRSSNLTGAGPVWTPLNPADKQASLVAEFGADVPMKRPAQPKEIAPAFVFLASPRCSSYITGEILPVIGGYGH